MGRHPSRAEAPARAARRVSARAWLAAAWLAVAGFPAGAAPGRAEEAPTIGKTFSGMLDLGDFQAPLPAGEWLLAGRGYDRVADMSDAASAIETLVLFRLEGGMVTAFATVQHNLVPIETGWGVAEECVRTDMALRLIFDADEGHSRCGFAAAVEIAPASASPAFWTSAVAFAVNRELKLPRQWLMDGLRLSDRRDVVDIRYHFSRELPGTPGAIPASLAIDQRPGQSGWLDLLAPWRASPEAATARPDAATIEKLDRWLQGMQALAALGFNRTLAGLQPPPMPWAQADAAAAAAGQRQLLRLDALRAARIVDDRFYAERRAAIQGAEVEVAPEQLSALELTALKAVADQSTTVMENLAVNAIVLGNLAQTMALLPLQTLADALQFTTHEYAWNTLGPNRVRESPAIGFVEVGTIRP
jgi:hypothetical protein